LGVNLDVMDVSSIDDGEFFVKFRVRIRRVILSGFWWLCTGQLNQNLRSLS
jgi:hypothetical protein